MGRFSPTVKPSSRPGGLGGLAAALQEGVAGYQGAQDRQEGQRARELNQGIQRGQALRQGIDVETPAEPEGFGSAFARALSGAPAPQPVSTAPAPGAFDVVLGEYQQIDPVTKLPKLPIQRSGNVTYDPNRELQAAAGMESARGNAQTGVLMDREGKSYERDLTRNTQALTQLGVPADKAGAYGRSNRVTEALMLPDERGPVRGTPEWEQALRREMSIRKEFDTPAAGSSLAGVTAMRTDALYKAGKYGYDSLEGILSGDNPATPEVEVGEAKQVPNWFEQQGAKIGIGAGNYLTSAEMRQIRSSGLILSDSWLRFTSGAAVPETEVERFAQGFLPVAGDDPGTLRIKSGARKVIIDAMRTAAGQGMEPGSMDAQTVSTVLSQIQQIDPEAAAIGRRWLRSGAPGRTTTTSENLVSEFESAFGGRKP